MPEIKQVKYDAQKGGELIVNFKFSGLVFIPYTFRYFSSQKIDGKILVQGEGNNTQPHDDFFVLKNSDKIDEPLINHNGRVILLSATVFSPQGAGSKFVVALEVYQDANGQGVSQSNFIGGDIFSGDLSARPSDAIVSMAVELIS
ncbi:MAG TPA: hypothetical protein VL443_15745 [Cyclobacteriaceae bacterium]|jgi:hypothetical protein|nr:hypothetical protein [Cyclobacteriaceae bacterium]